MENVLNITYTVVDASIEELDTAFVNENDLEETIFYENARNANSSFLMKMNHSPISIELTATNNSYFVKDNLEEFDDHLDSLSKLSKIEIEIEQHTTTETKMDTLKRGNSIRKFSRRVCNIMLKPIKSLRASTSKINTSEELSTISGLQYTSDTPESQSMTRITLASKSDASEVQLAERFKKVRLSSTKYEAIKKPSQLIDNNIILANEHTLRKFSNYGDIEVWHI